jgi:hypothetical protein
MKGAQSWGVRIFIPPPKGERWGKNKHFHVIAESLEESIDKIREKHPECVIFSICHYGEAII